MIQMSDDVGKFSLNALLTSDWLIQILDARTVWQACTHEG